MNNKGMSVVEYCVLFALVVAAWLAMNGYFKRAIEGNWRSNADSFSEGQYNPANDDRIDPGRSTESLSNSKLELVNPTIKVYMNISNSFVYDQAPVNASINMTSGGQVMNITQPSEYWNHRPITDAKILHIDKWGIY